LHPGADAGGASANPHQAKVAVAKCFKDPADQSSASPRASVPIVGRSFLLYWIAFKLMIAGSLLIRDLGTKYAALNGSAFKCLEKTATQRDKSRQPFEGNPFIRACN
jgi:hypothetical protein